jgi:hypothetical protein
MTYKQAWNSKPMSARASKGSLVAYADKIIRTGTDEHTGEASEHTIPFMKGYTVFNVEHDSLPNGSMRRPNHGVRRCSASRGRNPSLPPPEQTSGTAVTALSKPGLRSCANAGYPLRFVV